MKHDKYKLFERVGSTDRIQMDCGDGGWLTADEVVDAWSAGYWDDRTTVKCEFTLEGFVFWDDGKILAVALNDNESADNADAERYVTDHEQR